MRRVFAWMIVAFVGVAANAGATTIDFEGFAPVGGLVNVNPGAPYTEDGFTLTPTDGNSAVFDAAALSDFPPDITAWFGWAPGNIITLTGPSPFSLDSLILGPTTIGGPPTSITLVGNLFGGGTLTTTFSGLIDATPETLNWSNLESVIFRVTNHSGMDDLEINSVPEPGSLILLGTGVLGLISRARNGKKRNA